MRCQLSFQFNSFRPRKYTRSRFLDGDFLLSQEGTDIQLELLEYARHIVSSNFSNRSINDSWKVEVAPSVVSNYTQQLIVRPGTAYYDGLQVQMDSGLDPKVNPTTAASSGSLDQPATVGDAGGKLINFASVVTSGYYKIIAQINEEEVTALEDPFLQGAAVPETTEQKRRLIYTLISVSCDANGNLGNTTNTVGNASGINPLNFANTAISAGPPSTQQTDFFTYNDKFSVPNTYLTTTSTSDTLGSNWVVTLSNDNAGGVIFPTGSLIPGIFTNGLFIDCDGTPYYINNVQVSTGPDQVAFTLSGQLLTPAGTGLQNPPNLSNASLSYTLIAADVVVANSSTGIPTGTRNYPLAIAYWNGSSFASSPYGFQTTNGAPYTYNIYDLRSTDNNTFAKLVRGGNWSWDSGTGVLSWDATANIQMMGLDEGANTIPAGSTTLSNDGDVAYVLINTSLTGSNITLPSLIVDNSGNGLDITLQQALAQEFTLSSSAYINYIDIKLTAIGTPLGNIIVGLQADNSGNPSGTYLYSTTVAASSIAVNPSETLVSIPINASLAANNYHIVVSSDSTYKANYNLLSASVSVKVNNSPSSPPYGQAYNGSSWSTTSPITQFYYTMSGNAFNSNILTIEVVNNIAVPVESNLFVIARRINNDILVGANSFLLVNGESKLLDAGLSNQNITYIGATDESSATPLYSSSNIANGSLTTAIGDIDAFLSPEGDQYEPLVANASGAASFQPLPLNQPSATTGVLPGSSGGTGLSSITPYEVMIGNSGNSLTQVSGVGLTGQVLTSNGPGVAPTYQSVSGGSSKNYLSPYVSSTSGGIPNPGNGNFELGSTSGWSLANSVLSNFVPTSVASPGSAFSSSSGGSPASSNLSFSVVSSNQLAGRYSGDLASSAASTVGDLLISNAFYIDLEDQGKVLTFSFSYEAISGTFDFSGSSSNTFALYIYDVTNADWIQPAGVYNLVQGSGVGLCNGTFQTTSNSIEYQIALININASSGAYSLYVDDFSVGPQILVQGPPVTDWSSFSPTISGITVGNGSLTGNFRRVGDSMEISTTLVAGSSTSYPGDGGYFYINMPSGYSVDTSKFDNTQTVSEVFGVASALIPGSAVYTGDVTYLSNNQFIIDGPSTSDSWGPSRPDIWNTTSTLSIRIIVPILGWSSNTSMSNDTDTRVVSASVYLGTSYSYTTGNNIIFDTVDFDTHGAYSTSTGNYTVPVSGYYKIDGQIENSSSTAADSYIYKNGNVFSEEKPQESPDFTGIVSQIIKCVVGDTISLRVDANQTIEGNAVRSSFMTIARLSGPAIIAATDTVAMQVGLTTNTSLSANSNIIYNSVAFDTTGSYNTSTGNYTVPVSGYYQVNTSAINASGTSNYLVTKNGSTYYYVFRNSGASMSGSILLKCIAGDTISIQMDANATVQGNSGGGQTNFSLFLVH